jgi:Tfp pilus assembly protein PilF
MKRFRIFLEKMSKWNSRPTSQIRLACMSAFILAGAFLPLRVSAQAQSGQAASGLGGDDVGSIVVGVHAAGGGALDAMATVNVYTQSHQLYSSATVGPGSSRFDGVPLGTYIVEANVPGYFPAEEQIELMMRNDQRQVSLALRLLSDPSSRPVSTKPPLLAPKAQKELAKGLEELRANHREEALKHLQNAARLAPSNPEVNYLLGVVAWHSADPSSAVKYWQKAISFFPEHVLSLVALGETTLTQGDLSASKDYLDRAVAANPSLWRAHELLAHVCLQQGMYLDAQHEAERAVELGKNTANESRLVLAKAFIAQSKRVEATTALHALLEKNPPEELAASARRLLDGLARTSRESATSSSASAALPTASTATLRALQPLLPPLAESWKPPDVDDRVPSVEDNVPCRLDEILPKIHRNVVLFARSLDRYTATESLENQVVNEHGTPTRSRSLTFDYLVSMREIRPGILNVDEYRNGSLALDVFPDGLATTGLPAVILIFHPVHADDFEMRCEGLGSWRGIPAWQIHFRQSENREASVRTYRVNGAIHPVPLKGRAWVSRDSLQVVRIETDLIHAVPAARLFGEHQDIDYGPVRFANKPVELWLPASTDFYTDFRGMRIRRRLSYANYLLFSTDETQKIGKPAQPQAAAP